MIPTVLNNLECGWRLTQDPITVSPTTYSPSVIPTNVPSITPTGYVILFWYLLVGPTIDSDDGRAVYNTLNSEMNNSAFIGSVEKTFFGSDGFRVLAVAMWIICICVLFSVYFYLRNKKRNKLQKMRNAML